jgi:hypothetical protein
MVMIEEDMAPSENPAASHWQDALQKGMGRALMWTKNGVLPGKAILLDACLTDLRYDRQCEEVRGPWLWQIMDATGTIEDFREPILDSLRSVSDGLAAQQLCQFAVSYAMLGDHRFRHALQQIVSQKPAADCPWLGEEELVELDSTAGFLYSAKARASTLPDREWDWDDKAMLDMAIEKLGEQKVTEALERESESAPDLRRLLEGWRSVVERKASEPKQSHVGHMRQYSLSDVIQAAEAMPNRAGFLRGWGMYANEGDLQAVLECIFNSDKAELIANYLRVFSNRALPHFDDRMLGLLEHEDEQVRNRAYAAVAKNSHPAVRKFALEHLQTHVHQPNFVELFIKNYQPGDEDLLRDHLQLPEDPDDRHWLLMNVTKVLEENHGARCDVLSLWAYRWTPCGSCRYHAAKLLLARAAVPKWLRNECLFDCYTDTKELVMESVS